MVNALPTFSNATESAHLSLGSIGLRGFHVDPGRSSGLKCLDLRRDRADSLGRGENLKACLGNVTAVDWQGDDPVMSLLERSRVRVVRGGLEARHVAIAQTARILPQCKSGKLVLVEPQDDALVGRFVVEHGKRARIAGRAPACNSW